MPDPGPFIIGIFIGALVIFLLVQFSRGGP